MTSPHTKEALKRGAAAALGGHAAQLAEASKRRRWAQTPVVPLILEAFGRPGQELAALLRQRGAQRGRTAAYWQLLQTQLQRYTARQVMAALGTQPAVQLEMAISSQAGPAPSQRAVEGPRS